MSKKQPALLDSKTANIENLDALTKEFKKGTMPPRKLSMLKNKLVDLFIKEMSTEAEQELMEMIFRRERTKSSIIDKHKDILAEIEAGRCTERCIVKAENPPIVHHLVKDEIYDYVYDFENERHVVFVKIAIPASHQMSVEAVLKEQKGHPVDPSEYKPTRYRYERRDYKAKEFAVWFDIYDEDILDKEEKKFEESYEF